MSGCRKHHQEGDRQEKPSSSIALNCIYADVHSPLWEAGILCFQEIRTTPSGTQIIGCQLRKSIGAHRERKKRGKNSIEFKKGDTVDIVLPITPIYKACHITVTHSGKTEKEPTDASTDACSDACSDVPTRTDKSAHMALGLRFKSC